MRNFFVIGIVGISFGAAIDFALAHHWLPLLQWFLFPAWSIGTLFLLQGGVMLWGSKVGKLRLRDKLIASIPWRGDEHVLDVGCGHGLMLIAAAKKLQSGKAVGIDLWKTEDQAHNSRDATFRNAELEGIANKLELKTGDARKLPFPDNSFDVILSSWALHNIYDHPGRKQAILEIIRTLKRGGWLIIADIRHAADYAQILRENQFLDLKISRPNFLFVIPTHSISATKP